MDFSEALVLLKAGKPIARSEWEYVDPEKCIYLDKESGEIFEHGRDGDGEGSEWDTERPYEAGSDDLLADDWYDLTAEPERDSDEGMMEVK